MAKTRDPMAEIVRACESSERAFSNRAQFHIFLGALPEDFEDAEKCIELDPNFLLGYVCQAKVQALRCSDESARATYIEALEPVVIDGLNKCLTCIKRSEGRDVGPDNLNGILVIIFLCDKSSVVTFKQAQFTTQMFRYHYLLHQHDPCYISPKNSKWLQENLSGF